VLGHALEPLVQRPQPLEHLHAHEHAVELYLLAGLADEMDAHLRGPLAHEAMPLDEAPATRAVLHARVACGHVDLLRLGLADEVEGAHHPGSGSLCALDERREPARRGHGVIVDEHDVARADVAEAKVPPRIGHEVVRSAYEREAPDPGLGGEVAADRLRRATVDVDQVEGRRRVRVDRLEGPLADADPLRVDCSS
jgi:hypothetical protein